MSQRAAQQTKWRLVVWVGLVMVAAGVLGEFVLPSLNQKIVPIDWYPAMADLARWFGYGLYAGPPVLVAGLIGRFYAGESNLPDDEHIEWQFEVFEWLIERFPEHGSIANGRVLTPSPEDFPVGEAEGQELGERIFGVVRRHCGLEEWPCELEAVDDRQVVIDAGGVHEFSGAAGTILASSDEVVITYNLSSLAQPESVVSTFAHELSHYLLFSIDELPPGGEAADEPATDLCAVYLGFGTFMANSAFRFESAAGEGWMVNWQGYLSQPSLATALAIFVRVLDAPADAFTPHLATNPREYFRQALAYVDEHFAERLASLRRLRERAG